MRSFLLLLFLFCGTLFAQQKPDTVFTLGKVGKAPVIDGKITPGEWKDAASTAALVNYVNNKAGSRFASVAVAADQKNICFLFKSELPPQGMKLKTMVEKNNWSVFKDDNVELTIRPPRGRYVYQLVFNEKALVQERRFPVHNGNASAEDLQTWKSNCRVRSGYAGNLWLLEVAVPLASLELARGLKAEDELRILAGRNWYQPFMQTTLRKAGNFIFPAEMASFVYRPEKPVISFHGAGKEWKEGKFAFAFSIVNPSLRTAKVAYRIDVSSDAAPRQSSGEKVILPGKTETVLLAFTEKSPVKRHLTAVFTDQNTGKVLFHRSVIFDPADKTTWVRPDKKTLPELEYAVYPYLKKLKMRFGRADLPAGNWKSAVFSLVRDGRIFRTVPGEKWAFGFENIISCELSPGNYILQLACTDPAGKKRTFSRAFKIEKFPWEHNQIGCDRIIIPPFKPLTYSGSRQAGATLTGYTFGNGFFKTVSAGKNANILASPITLKINGKPLREKHFAFTEKSPDRARFESELLWEGGKILLRGDLDYDGFCKFTMNFQPEKKQKISSACLEIALKKEFARFIHATCDRMRYNTCRAISKRSGVVWQSSRTTRTVKRRGNFHPYIWFGDRQNGIAWMCESDKFWSLDHAKDAQSLERKEDSVILKINFVNKPVTWEQPFTIVQALQATPVKPQPDYRRKLSDRLLYPNAWTFGLLAGGCAWSGGFPWQLFTPINGDYSFIDFMAKKNFSSQTSQKFIRDFIARNMPGATDKEIRRMRTGMAKGAYLARTARYLIPYLNARVTLKSWKAYQTYMDEWWCSEYRANDEDEYNITPVRSYQDCILYDIRKLLQKGMSGVYYDNIRDWQTPDPVRGPAWRMADGFMQTYFDIFDTRELLKRTAVMLYQEKKVFPDGRPIFICHMTNTNLVPFLSFSTLSLDLEAQFGSKDFQYRFSDGYLQACTLGQQTGAVPYILVEISGALSPEMKERINRTFIAVTLAYDLPLVSNAGGLSPLFHKTWHKLYTFGYSTPQVQVYPSWEKGNPAVTDCRRWKLSSYVKKETKETVVAVCSWTSDRSGRITLPGAVSCMDMESRKMLPVTNGSVVIQVPKNDFKLLKFTTK